MTQPLPCPVQRYNSLIPTLTHSLGWCCPFAYFAATANLPRNVIADALGVDVRTIQRYRRQARHSACHITPTLTPLSPPAHPWQCQCIELASRVPHVDTFCPYAA